MLFYKGYLAHAKSLFSRPCILCNMISAQHAGRCEPGRAATRSARSPGACPVFPRPGDEASKDYQAQHGNTGQAGSRGTVRKRRIVVRWSRISDLRQNKILTRVHARGAAAGKVKFPACNSTSRHRHTVGIHRQVQEIARPRLEILAIDVDLIVRGGVRERGGAASEKGRSILINSCNRRAIRIGIVSPARFIDNPAKSSVNGNCLGC